MYSGVPCKKFSLNILFFLTASAANAVQGIALSFSRFYVNFKNFTAFQNIVNRNEYWKSQERKEKGKSKESER